MTESYWQRDASWADRWATTAVQRDVDLAIIGGGFAGLATAIRYREQNPAARVLLLEAERVGSGASGRNAGFLSPLAAPVWLLGAERIPEHAWGAARINALVHEQARWIAAHVPDCEIAPARLALQARTRVADASLATFARAVAHTGLAHEARESRVWPGHRVLAMDAYTLHPYKLVRGLALHAEQLGIQIRERARVSRAEAQRAGGARVHLEDGTVIEAGKVVLCTNAYTPELDAGERVRGAFVVHSFLAASAPLPALPRRDGEFTVEVTPSQSYHRTHGGRVIYGGVDKLRAPTGAERGELERQIAGSFPDARVPIEHVWTGRFQTTVTGLPIIRMAEDNHAIVFNVAYGGTGVALSLACARLAAAVASHGKFTSADDTRLLALIHATRISVRDAARTIARIARAAAMPWLRA
ncbi:MAG: FAD-dependent oxidoreductase [Myxococcales bacterium]|nr:FAD-dependent oxidoreductase [Myxococcales bacterium]